MDLSALLTPAGASAYQQGQLVNQVQSAVDGKILNIARQQGEGALQLLQSALKGIPATTPGVGESVDALA